MEEAQGLSERSIELCFEWVMIEDKGWGIAQLIEGLLCIHEALASIPRTEKKKNKIFRRHLQDVQAPGHQGGSG